MGVKSVTTWITWFVFHTFLNISCHLESSQDTDAEYITVEITVWINVLFYLKPLWFLSEHSFYWTARFMAGFTALFVFFIVTDRMLYVLKRSVWRAEFFNVLWKYCFWQEAPITDQYSHQTEQAEWNNVELTVVHDGGHTSLPVRLTLEICTQTSVFTVTMLSSSTYTSDNSEVPSCLQQWNFITETNNMEVKKKSVKKIILWSIHMLIIANVHKVMNTVPPIHSIIEE